MSKESFERMDLVHIAISGAICFGITVLVIDIAQNLLQQMLYNQGMLGVVFFTDYYSIARALFLFGLVYLTSGFCGGVYLGYNVYIEMKKTLVIPAVIGTVGFIILAVFLANYPVNSYFIGLLLLQFTGNAAGSYLGGYSINWGLLHEKTETREEFTLEKSKQPQ
jgi:hypothetical protein